MRAHLLYLEGEWRTWYCFCFKATASLTAFKDDAEARLDRFLLLDLPRVEPIIRLYYWNVISVIHLKPTSHVCITARISVTSGHLLYVAGSGRAYFYRPDLRLIKPIVKMINPTCYIRLRSHRPLAHRRCYARKAPCLPTAHMRTASCTQ